MSAVVHKFPVQDGGRQWLANTRPAPEVEVFDQSRVRELNAVVQRVFRASEAIVDLLQSDRDLAHQAGLESIGIEISAILEGDKFDRVMDTVEEAVQKDIPVTLTRDGLSRVRRLESLLAEAQKNINRFAPDIRILEERDARLGQRRLTGDTKSLDPIVMGSMIILGGIAVALIVYAAATTDRK